MVSQTKPAIISTDVLDKLNNITTGANGKFIGGTGVVRRNNMTSVTTTTPKAPAKLVNSPSPVLQKSMLGADYNNYCSNTNNTTSQGGQTENDSKISIV